MALVSVDTTAAMTLSPAHGKKSSQQRCPPWELRQAKGAVDAGVDTGMGGVYCAKKSWIAALISSIPVGVVWLFAMLPSFPSLWDGLAECKVGLVESICFLSCLPIT